MDMFQKSSDSASAIVALPAVSQIYIEAAESLLKVNKAQQVIAVCNQVIDRCPDVSSSHPGSSGFTQ